MKWTIAADGCRSLSEAFPAFARPLRTQIMQHSASRCHTALACSQWLSESLGCCSLPFFFYGPLRANML